jgi:hypothetical protein
MAKEGCLGLGRRVGSVGKQPVGEDIANVVGPVGKL